MPKTKTILAVVDNSQASRGVFKESLVLASSLRARLVVISVTPQYEGNMNRFFMKDFKRQINEPFQEILKETESYAESLGLKIHTIHRMGRPCDEILTAAVEEHACIILCSNTRESQVEKMLIGSTLEELIAASPCDLLILPNQGEIKFNRIMVGTDGTVSSAEAEQRTIDIALSYGSEVHAVCGIDLPVDKSLRYAAAKDIEQKGRKALNIFAEKTASLEISTHIELLGTVPEQSLSQYAREKKVQLLVLGCHDNSGMFDMFNNGVVSRTIPLSPCPILIAKKTSGDNCFLRHTE
jgi:nucleotide-binding universal stress UspA family protein